MCGGFFDGDRRPIRANMSQVVTLFVDLSRFGSYYIIARGHDHTRSLIQLRAGRNYGCSLDSVKDSASGMRTHEGAPIEECVENSRRRSRVAKRVIRRWFKNYLIFLQHY